MQNLAQHVQREKAIKALYQMDFHLEKSGNQATREVVAAFLDNYDDVDTLSVPNYLTTLVDGVLASRYELENLIADSLQPGWSLRRLQKIDLYIMEVALFEMLYEQETIPPLGAISEALEIADSYSDEKSKKFINGVLSKIYKEKFEAA
ncbi:MAG: transcription antitermination factor NusB [Lactobacillales bacterium]|jgi:N utilization substance protein B|nr:transcription antitermination factor NusB [Lactobacillales bacterium]